MTDTKRTAGRGWRIAGWVAAGVVGVPAALAMVLAMTGQPLPLPRAVLDMAQQQIDFALRRAGTVGANVQVGRVEVVLDRAFRPRIDIGDIRLSDRQGRPVAFLPAARLTFDRPSFARPVPLPRAVVLDGARIYAQRREDGSFDLAIGVAAGDGEIQSYPAAMEDLRRALTLPLADRLRLLDIRDVGIRIDDARAGRRWELAGAQLTVRRPDRVIEAELSARVEGTEEGRVDLAATLDPDAGTTALAARIAGISAPDIAAQAAPLAALAVLDATVGGTLRASVDADGTLGGFAASLDLGQGALAPREGMEPIPFDAATLALTYDPAAGKIALDRLRVEGPTLRVTADGHVYLQDMTEGLPATYVTQLRFQDIAVDPQGAFTEPVRFSSGNLDARLRLNPFTVDIGQVALVEGERVLRGRGRISADPQGWRLAFDPSLNRIRRDQLLALWPLRLVPRTREWLDENVLEGDLHNVRAAIRIAPGIEPRVSLNYSFQGGDVRFLRTLPPIESGEGFASIHRERYAMKLERGHVTPPEGGVVTADGSTLVVPDLRDEPIRVNIGLLTDSSVTAALSLLDQPPFRFLSRAGRAPDLGTGHAKVTARLSVPVERDLNARNVGFDVTGTITDFASDTLVKGRHLTAPALRLTATPEALEVGGAGHLDTLPFDATYRLPLEGGTAAVEGTTVLSQAALDMFRIPLPKGMVSGQADGLFRVDLPKTGAPVLDLTSELRGVSAAIPAIGWSKPAAAGGGLQVRAVLSDPPEVQRLHLHGGGLEAEGRVALTPSGGLDRVDLSRVRLNGWLDAPVVLTARDGGTPAVAVQGGTVDLRRLNLGGGGSGGSGDTPVTARLDTLRITDTLALTDVAGDFATGGGFHGRFAGRVNGGTPLSGEVRPAANGTAVHVISDDAGGVLRSAGIYPKVEGGVLDLRLTPRAGDGEYDGQAVVTGPRLIDPPAAVAAIGGGNVAFDRATATFRMTPGAIEITEGAATGPSLGVSAAGVYRLTDRRFFLQGVVTPLYFVNGGGRADGEGLFGITWRLRGTADAPEIHVNPLSVLTPGVLRGLVQGDAPRLAE